MTTIQLSYEGYREHPENFPDEDCGPRSFVYRSKDDGKTWQKGSSIGEHTCETQLLHKQDGSILAMVRRHGYSLPPEHIKRLFVADSHDQGHTWVNLRLVCRVKGCCHGEAVQLSDGRIVILHDKRYPNTDGQVQARISHDGGRNWEPQIYIVCRGHGYPGSVVLSDDTIVTVTGDEYTDERGHTDPDAHAAQVIRWRVP